MADIRINALATTATTPASDDYLALDGTAQGTRKILATNIANNVTDVILGASGPSVKSTLSARAPRQGLVQDGTSGSSVTLPAFGTSDFSYFTWVNISNYSGINGITSGANGSFAFYIDNSNGLLVVDKRGVVNVGSSSSAVPTGKFVSVGYTRSGTTGTFYINGIAAGTATDSQDYSVAGSFYGSINPQTQNPLRGTLLVPYAYNRALSASEVVALYEAGAPAGADYNSASNTSVAPASFASGWTIGGGSPTLSTTATMANGDAIYFDVTLPTISSRRYRAVFTTTGTGQVKLTDLVAADYTGYLSAGSQSVEFTLSKVPTRFGIYANGNVVVSSLTLVPIGALLAPDAAQAGGGLVWYDTSGNAANITLPASGVSWNVPTSAKTATGWTFGGNLTTTLASDNFVKAISTAGEARLELDYYGTGGYGSFQIYRDGTRKWRIGVVNNNDANPPLQFWKEGTGEYARFTTGGNLLLKSDGIDSANGKLQLATHTTSAGGIGFGTDTSLFRQATGEFVFLSTGSNITHSFNDSGGNKAVIGTVSGDLYVQTTTAKSVYLRTNSTTALTLDSSQNATFAGDVVLGAGKRVAYSASAYMTPENNVDGAEIASPGQFTVKTASTQALKIDSSQNATFGGNIKTAAPSGGTAATWRLGTVASVSPTSPNRTIEVEIGGTTYYIHAKTTND